VNPRSAVIVAPVLVLLALRLISAPANLRAQAEAPDRNCPENADQVIAVTPGQPAIFRIAVHHLGDGQVSIFQYPLGGSLQQSGPTPLDFVFIPQQDFNGSTDLTYRVIPPFGCPRTVQLGRVTLVGGHADSTAVGLVPTVPSTLCGIGSFAPLGIVGITLFRTQRRGRRTREPV